MKLYNVDSYAFIQQMRENKLRVHHIITDPPYNISKPNNFPSMRQRRQGVDFYATQHNKALCAGFRVCGVGGKKWGKMGV